MFCPELTCTNKSTPSKLSSTLSFSGKISTKFIKTRYINLPFTSHACLAQQGACKWSFGRSVPVHELRLLHRSSPRSPVAESWISRRVKMAKQWVLWYSEIDYETSMVKLVKWLNHISVWLVESLNLMYSKLYPLKMDEHSCIMVEKPWFFWCVHHFFTVTWPNILNRTMICRCKWQIYATSSGDQKKISLYFCVPVLDV